MNNRGRPRVPDGDGPLTADEEAALDAELAATESVFGAELAQLLVVPADLQRRTTSEVTDGLLARSSWSAAVDLVGLGWRTMRLLATTPPEESEMNHHWTSGEPTNLGTSERPFLRAGHEERP